MPCILTEILPDRTSLTGIWRMTSVTRPSMISTPGSLRRLFTFAVFNSRFLRVTLPFRSCNSRFSREKVCGSRKVPRICVRAYERRRFWRFEGRRDGSGSQDGAIWENQDASS